MKSTCGRSRRQTEFDRFYQARLEKGVVVFTHKDTGAGRRGFLRYRGGRERLWVTVSCSELYVGLWYACPGVEDALVIDIVLEKKWHPEQKMGESPGLFAGKSVPSPDSKHMHQHGFGAGGYQSTDLGRYYTYVCSEGRPDRLAPPRRRVRCVGSSV